MEDFRTKTMHVLPGALTALAWVSLALPAAAHPGHGGGDPHWHASDLFGFVMLAALVVGAALWWRGRK